MTALDTATVNRIRRETLQVQLDDRVYTVRTSAAREGLLTAELEVVNDAGEIVGFIAPYSDRERGAVKARFFGVGLPAAFSSVEDALAEILP